MIPIKRSLLAVVNRVLRIGGVALHVPYDERDSWFCDEDSRHACADAAAGFMDRFIASAHGVPWRVRRFNRRHFRRFFDEFPTSPIGSNSGGNGFNNCLSLFAIGAALQPDLIMESGTYAGVTSLVLRHAAPQAELHSFDLTLFNLRKRAERCSYHASDWSSWSVPVFRPESALCFFDDHIDQARRVIEAFERGFRYLVFDDNCSVAALHRGAYSHAFPKIDFLFEKSLRDGQSIAWHNGNRRLEWVVDMKHIREARRHIAGVFRLPDLSSVTGYSYQPPLTLVVLNA